MKLVGRAKRDKVPVLEGLKVVLRLCQDAKAFANFAAFEQASTKAVEIAKQNEGCPSCLRSLAARCRAGQSGLVRLQSA